MRISDFAARAGLTPRQVRHYTDVGLLPAARLGNGYRDYDPAHVEQARRGDGGRDGGCPRFALCLDWPVYPPGEL